MSAQAPERAVKPGISVFYPFYNDWGTMGSMVLLTLETVERLGVEYDVTIVNDGSHDPRNRAVLDEIERRFPSVRVLHHEKNRGYGGALRSGFAAGTREWIFYTDGDAQYDVRELEELYKQAGPEVDLVQGYKIARGDPLHRIVIGRIYHHFVRLIFGIRVRDTDCDFRLLRRSMFDDFTLESDSGTICVELMFRIKKGGYRIVEVPVHHFQRAHGRSQFFNFPRLARTLRQLVQLWFKLVVFGK
ncbi:MAG: glycosyltransferase family 2 protein [Candidatus Hydrogenedentes bacterium]|nr:glycosyltransferase family 2 protein [Candidatus Hydrogenedentota bacterium]